MRVDIKTDYFNWLYDLACADHYDENYISYRRLFEHLHNTDFTWMRRFPLDSNRAKDGVDLRRRFVLRMEEYRRYYDEYIRELDGPCSVLEMIAALALRMEEDTMDDPELGNRASYWFWVMLQNLGVSTMTDSRYDKSSVEDVLDIFLNRKYSADGRGGLFVLRHHSYDLRTCDIWVQAGWYMDELLY